MISQRMLRGQVARTLAGVGLSVALLATPGCKKGGGDRASSAGASSGSGGSAGDDGMGGAAGDGGSGGASTGGSGGNAPSCVNSDAILAEHVIDEASPLVSVDRPIVGSDGVESPELLVDGEFRGNQYANFGTLENGPEWVAIDVGEGPKKLLLMFADNGTSRYDSISGGAPVGYTIETSADSTDGSDGEWEMAVEVTDNPVRTRAHSFAFEGMRWVRFTATEPPPDRSVRLLEILLHDISDSTGERPQDSWVFFGDSISQAALTRNFGSVSFASVVADAHPGFSPIALNASIGGELLTDAIARLDQLLDLNPDIQHIAIAYGTNDSWGNQNAEAVGFRDKLVQVVETILDRGRTPIIARIPYASEAHRTLPEFNDVIDEVQAEYGLPCGPDLYSWFLEHPEQLGPDGVHPNSPGNVQLNALWAEAAGALYLDE